jgi:hypothetical protein
MKRTNHTDTNADKHRASPQNHSSLNIDQDIDQEVIIVDNTKAGSVKWEMSALDALKVNYVTRYNKSICH